METPKSKRAEREEEILAFWQKNHIFEKTLNKPSSKGEFVFYEGPPTANGRPGIHHLEARAFKDAIPRFKTMQGYHVRRKGGWDTHGLPVELQVEKELGLKSKKEIEEYGIEKFNQKCKESVWKYVDEWVKFTNRIGYWIDLKNPYVTYRTEYVESLWSIFKKVHEKDLLYKDYKVVPWCPRCGTALSSHELAQGYQEVKDLSVYVKFKLKASVKDIKDKADEYFLAWTTTPWTLPGNVALAINPNIVYIRIGITNQDLGMREEYILAKERLSTLKDRQYEILGEIRGEKLVGLEYEPLYPFLKENLPKSEQEKLPKAFKVYAADFVTTEDGTGIVHTAVMYGADDFELGTKVGLPKYHLVKEDGTFKEETGFLAGKFVKDEETAVAIIKDLHSRGLLFAKEKYEHSYPFCWRCKTPLIYFARDSWYIRMSELREKLLENNEKINWEPAYIKEGRFGEWLKDAKDWAISRERYWGTPLPVWECGVCKRNEVIGSLAELSLKAKRTLTRFILIRHGESTKNEQHLFSSERDEHPLTAAGKASSMALAKHLKGVRIDRIVASPILRTRETAEILSKENNIPLSFDDRLWEVRSGKWDGKGMRDPEIVELQRPYFADEERYYKDKRGEIGESWKEVELRMIECIRDLEKKFAGKTVAIVSHEGPLLFLLKGLRGASVAEVREYFSRDELGGYASAYNVYVESDTAREFDPHRPNVDAVTYACTCGKTMKRVKEVIDVWFDSGAMPFAQDHYPFDFNKVGLFKRKKLLYPADFISEAIDQTRGWFYTLHAVGTLLGKGPAYKNVICLGHILDAEGKKMSKSLGNVVDPWAMSDKYGVDALRFWMYSVNQPGESKNFDEKTVDEIGKKVFNLLDNVLSFYQMYAGEVAIDTDCYQSPSVLDQWILARLSLLTTEATEHLESYKLLEPTRSIREFLADLSQWYIRRSRDRFKSDDKNDKMFALQTTRTVLLSLAKLLAPLAPFYAEHVYQSLKGGKESVHFESWPEIDSRFKVQGSKIIGEMKEVRKLVSLGLEQRSKSNIKVRQPLRRLKVKKNITQELFELVKDEVNVHEVVFDGDINDLVELDTTITPELREEGDVREIIRAIQDLRKRENLTPSDKASLQVGATPEGEALFRKFDADIRKITNLKEIVFAPTEGERVETSNGSIIISIEN